jgi:predicted Fe-Mo cluster-binding NifX family protein
MEGGKSAFASAVIWTLMIRVAIATTDGVSLSPHLARSAAFVVFDVEDGQITSRSVRTRESDTCGNHKSFVEMVEGCGAVICGGIGQGAFDSLRMAGIEPVVAAGPHSIEETLKHFMAGTLATTSERTCLCH